MMRICALLLLITTQGWSQWELEYDKDGVKVYSRTESGVGTLSIKGETTIDASLPALIEVLADNKRAAEWMPRVAGKKTLRQIDSTTREEVTYIDMPWPIKDRYFVNLGRRKKLNDKTTRLEVESVKNPDHVEEDMILGILHYSMLDLTPLGESSTHVMIEVNSDPKGSLPGWLVRWAQKRWPRKFFKGLKNQLQKLELLAH